MAGRLTVRLRADVRCYMCARIAGILEWEPTKPGATATYRLREPGRHAGPLSLERLTCPYCGGQTFLDEIEEIRVAEPIELFPARRGRPRKVVAERIPA